MSTNVISNTTTTTTTSTPRFKAGDTVKYFPLGNTTPPDDGNIYMVTEVHTGDTTGAPVTYKIQRIVPQDTASTDIKDPVGDGFIQPSM